MKHSIKILILSIIVQILPISKFDKANSNDFNNMFVLGDSLSDTGAFSQYQGDFTDRLVIDNDCKSKGGFRPPLLGNSRCYKFIQEWQAKSFKYPFYKHSFSNGPVAVQWLADRLGITNFCAASSDANKFDNFGYNYATGTAKILKSEELIEFEIRSRFLAFSLQSDRYSLTEQVKKLKQHHAIIDKKDLLIVNIGSNDVLEIIRALEIFAGALPRRIMEQRLNTAVELLFKEVETLIDYGFKRIIIGNVPDLSKIPMFNDNELAQIFAREFVNKYNEFFDLKFNLLMTNSELTKKIRKFDMNRAFDETLRDYQLSSKNVNLPAVGIDWVVNFFFSNDFKPYFLGDADENNIDNYAFFDDIHPTGSFHNQVSEKLYEVASKYWPYE